MLSPPGRDAKRVVFSTHKDWSAFMVVPLVGRSDDVRRSAANLTTSLTTKPENRWHKRATVRNGVRSLELRNDLGSIPRMVCHFSGRQVVVTSPLVTCWVLAADSFSAS
jgi:hypothetical protein